MVDKIDVYDVATKLIGPINAVGESNTDQDRYENLKQTIDTIERLLQDISDASRSSNNYQASMKKIGQKAEKFLRDIGEEYANHA